MAIAFFYKKAIGMSSDIDQILYPQPLSSLRENVPPVQCFIWKGEEEYELIELEVHPFDTIDDIKRMICEFYKNDPSFLPRFMFVGVPLGKPAYDEYAPELDVLYLPIDYLWYPNGTNDATQTYQLKHPLEALLNTPDNRFITSMRSYASPNCEFRGRSTIEDVFLKPRNGKIPIFHVFPLDVLMKSYSGQRPIPEAVWNTRFAPYFPNVNVEGPYRANDEDLSFLKKINFFVSSRARSLRIINNLLETVSLQAIEVTGIRQMLLTWKNPVQGFEGCASMFYQLRALRIRPYLRLLPAEGSGITKLHVDGIVPIPSLEDPRVLEVWNREISPTPGIDFCCIKYIHRPAMANNPPIYGTIHVLNDGTINLLLQPPKSMRKLNPTLDFRHFTGMLQKVFVGLPQSYNSFELREIAVMFSIKVDSTSPKFNRARIQRRLPYFQTLLKEIKSIPEDNPMISLRYKGVSQYATENNILTFITQLATSKSLDGEALDASIIDAIQNEFQFSKKEAVDAYVEWRDKKGIFTLKVPDDGEFIESFNPGIDIHIYPQHPSYFVHANRIDSDDSYRRICTLLALLFIEDDSQFRYNADSEAYSQVDADLEKESLEREEASVPEWAVESHTAANASFKQAMEPNPDTASSVLLEDDPLAQDDMLVGEVRAELAPDPFGSNQANQAAQAGISEAGISEMGRRAKSEEAVEVNKKKPTMAQFIRDMEQKSIDPKSWFIKKLQEVDPALFIYKTSKDKDGYTRQCAGNEDRQPSILSKEQYDQMREIYAEDPIFFIVYPLEGSEEPIQPVGVEETVTLMRYGSSGDSIHYYFCPQYFCLNDQIMIRPVDFAATTDRDDNPKPEDSCPFCYGKLITNKKAASVGHTVIKRKNKSGSAKYHSYIKFLDETSHPSNFALPCCFVRQSTLRISNPEFSHIRDYLQEMEVRKINDDESEEEEEGDLTMRIGEPVEYGVLFEFIYKKYILESNKYPDAGTFAIAPPTFDTYFTQNSGDSIVTRVAIHLKLRPNANGFLRIGTEYSENESLLAVIAPLLYKNTIEEVKSHILQLVTPRVFINSHFGNLVLEFYHPANMDAMPPTRQALHQWSEKDSGLGIPVTSANMYALIRLYNAYWHFRAFINDKRQRKDLRHIQPLLAEPGLLVSRGILLIVMEDNGTSEVTVRCPVFGVSLDRHLHCDIAFISRRVIPIGTTNVESARYELYLHTSNKAAKGGEERESETIIRWDNASREWWPEIVKLRVDEYMTQCKSRYRSLYTAQSGINPMAMIPLSIAVDAFASKPEGIIKDSYNHVISVAFRSKPGPTSPLIALPVVDDGIISISSMFSIKNIYLDWEDMKPATVEDVIMYYKTKIEPKFLLYPGYRVKHIVRHKEEEKIVAVRLENGIYIPASPPKKGVNIDELMEKLNMTMIDVDEFEWAIDKQLAGIDDKKEYRNWTEDMKDMSIDKRCGTDERLTRSSSYKEFEELYQQFRLMVSNWILSQAGSGIREEIEKIIFNSNLPEYERRKRLYIYISTELLSWFYPNDDLERKETSFLRKDCRMIDRPEACTGTCYWKQDIGKCLLHVKEEVNLSEKEVNLNEKEEGRMVSTPELFTKRIIDEFVRFPLRRKQLMKKGEISKLSAIVKPIHYEDQYIIPESSFTWANLLRLDWTTQILEEPKYYEEMSGDAEAEEKYDREDTLPPSLIPIFGKGSTYHVNIPPPHPSEPFAPFATILGVTMEQIGMEPSDTMLTVEHMIQYVNETSRPIGIIDVRNRIDIQFAHPRTGQFDTVTIIVYMEDAIGILMEEGHSTIRIASMPTDLAAAWKIASVPPIVKKDPVEEESILMIPGKNQVMMKKKRKPLVARRIQEPLVAVPFVEKPIEVAKKKPQRAPTASQFAPQIAIKRKPQRAPTASAMSSAMSSAMPSVTPAASSSAFASSSAIPASAIKKRPTVLRESSGT